MLDGLASMALGVSLQALQVREAGFLHLEHSRVWCNELEVMLNDIELDLRELRIGFVCELRV